MQSRYTTQQRRKIYLAAANAIGKRTPNGNVQRFCCNAIKDTTGLNKIEQKDFQELYLFKRGDAKCSIVWWQNEDGTDKQLLKQRAIALLLCAEMCND